MPLALPTWQDGHTPASDEMNGVFRSVERGVNAALQNRGNWDSNKTYEANDVVTHAHARFYALRDVAAGVQPGANGSGGDWTPLAGGNGSGDMLKAAYDSDNDGKVDAAEVADAAPWSGITNKPVQFPPSAHAHTSGEISDFAEAVGDTISTVLQAGTNVTLAFDDNANTLTINATGGGAGGGSGDMLAETYDPDGDGIVEHAAYADSANTANSANSATSAQSAQTAQDAQTAVNAQNAGSVPWTGITGVPSYISEFQTPGLVQLQVFGSGFFGLRTIQFPHNNIGLRQFSAYLIVGTLRASTTNGQLFLRFNAGSLSDTTYDWQQVTATGSAQTVSEARAANGIALGSLAPSSAGDANGATSFRISIFNCTNGNAPHKLHHLVQAELLSIDDSSIVSRIVTGRFKNTDALTAMALMSTVNLANPGYVAFYGVQ